MSAPETGCTSLKLTKMGGLKRPEFVKSGKPTPSVSGGVSGIDSGSGRDGKIFGKSVELKASSRELEGVGEFSFERGGVGRMFSDIPCPSEGPGRPSRFGVEAVG